MMATSSMDSSDGALDTTVGMGMYHLNLNPMALTISSTDSGGLTISTKRTETAPGALVESRVNITVMTSNGPDSSGDTPTVHTNGMETAPDTTEMSHLNPTVVVTSSTDSSAGARDATKSSKNCSYVDVESQKVLNDHNLGKKYEIQQHPGTASFGMSVFNLSNTIMGSGILGLSFAMANTGIALFLILLIAVLIFSLYSVHLLVKTANIGGAIVYEQLGQKAFGLAGKLAASIAIALQNLGAIASYLFIVKYELPVVLQAFMGISQYSGQWYLNGDFLVLIVCAVIILPLSLMKRLGYLGYTSSFSLLCMVFFMIVVIYKKFHIPCVTAASEPCMPKYFVFNSQTAYSIPIICFAFVCHPAILPLYDELKIRSRKRIQNVANVSFFSMFVMYLLTAVFGYLTFYDSVEPELLHTYAKTYSFDTLLLTVRLAVLTAVTLTVPVIIFPLRTSFNTLFCKSVAFSWVRHFIVTFLLLALAIAFVVFVPSIRDIFGIIGGTSASMLIFILPSSFYLRVVKNERLISVQKIGAILFLILGFFILIGSMGLIIHDWIYP